ncbi:hypothetical protein ACFVAJ_19175 [Agromyces sp. NPDC057679]|uniref:hypothetical protein n=1 Tax=Agromyces sp. NPDC057679 TaxID=3346207 RepID=UPI0036709DCC
MRTKTKTPVIAEAAGAAEESSAQSDAPSKESSETPDTPLPAPAGPLRRGWEAIRSWEFLINPYSIAVSLLGVLVVCAGIAVICVFIQRDAKISEFTDEAQDTYGIKLTDNAARTLLYTSSAVAVSIEGDLVAITGATDQHGERRLFWNNGTEELPTR